MAGGLWRRTSLALALATIVAGAAGPPTADTISAAVVRGDWATANQLAARLDASEGGGDFFRAYVKASELIQDGQCPDAQPLLMLMRLTRPYFLPTYELSFVCHKSAGDQTAAIADLDA